MTTESITITNTPANPTLEESAAKAGIDPAAIDATATEQTASDRPSWLPQKFSTPEDMAKSYAELEKKLGGKEEPVETPNVPAEQTEEGDESTEDEGTPEEQAQEAADKAGLDLEALSAKYWENDGLEDTDYEALEKAGYPRHLVDQFAEGQKAIQQATRSAVFTEVGGEETYRDMIDWAGKNYSPAEIKAYDKAMAGTSEDRMSAVKALKARYGESEGIEPVRTVEGRTTRRGDSSVYESVEQLQADMRNPKYHKDAAFRAKVEAKLGRSDIM